MPTERDPFREEDELSLVWNVLNRNQSILPMASLKAGLDRSRIPVLSTGRLAIGFDTNAIYRVGLGKRGPDAVDYLGKLHKGPVIIPGQAIQEVWNNLLAAVSPNAKVLRKKLEEFKSEVEKIDQQLGATGDAVRDAVEDLIQVHGDWIDPKSVESFDTTLDMFSTTGNVFYVPRNEFADLARIRKDTKTPPGFQDAVGYGDFYIWADFLLGVASSQPAELDGVVLVTNDVKADWSRNGVPHPVLVAEAEAIADAVFNLWTLDDFYKYVGTAMSSAGK